MQQAKAEETLNALVQRDPRFHREAYLFLREALDYTQKMAVKGGKDELSRSTLLTASAEDSTESKEAIHHVSGQELLAGIRALALQQFGPMTLLVFENWGVKACEDFGEIVFNMVEANLLAKTEKDSREDFKGGYDFFTAFRQPFLPAHKEVLTTDDTKSTQV